MSTNVTPAAAPTTPTPAPAAPEAAPQTNPNEQAAPLAASAKTEAPKAEATEPKSVEATRENQGKYEIKVNGKSRWVSRDELIKLAQLSESANERFESAVQKERRVQEILRTAKSNPIQALQDPELGLTKEQIRAAVEDWYHREYVEPETLTPEQKRLRDLERENAIFKKMQEEQRLLAEKEAQERAEAEYAEHFQKQIIDAMDANRLPKTKSMVKRIAFYMRQSLANGWEAPMDLIIQKVKDDRRNEDAEINEYGYDDIVDRFGEEFVDRLMAEKVKRLKEKRALSGAQSFGGKTPEPSESKRDTISMSEAARRLKALRQGR